MGTAIKTAIVERGRTITEVAESIGLTYDMLSNIINGRTKAKAPLLEKMRMELRQPDGWPFVTQTGNLAQMPLGELRVLGKVAAGGGATSDIDEYEMPVPITLCGPDRVGWIVEGDSMYPFLQEGDLAVFKASVAPKINYPNLVRTPTGEYRTKMIRHGGKGYLLHSINPEYSDEPASVEYKGVLVGIYRSIGMREEMVHDPSGLRPEKEFS